MSLEQSERRVNGGVRPSGRSAPPADPWPEDRAMGHASPWPVGTVLYRQGDPVTSVFLVDDGLVLLSERHPHARTVAAVHGRTSILGSAGAVLTCRHAVTARTQTSCHGRCISVAALLLLIRTNPDVSQWLHRTQARESSKQLGIIRLLQTATAYQAFEYLLLDLLDLSGRARPNGTTWMEPSLSASVLGQVMGARRESVTRMLAQLEKEGRLLRKDGWWICRVERGRLVEIRV